MLGPAPACQHVPDTLGHYQLLEMVGAGGMGEVYRARDTRLERIVAVKVLPARSFTEEKARKRFREEALSLSRINHPNVATIFDFDSQDGIDFLVMEFIEGTTLSEMVALGPLERDQFATLALQLADGLAAAHEQNVVHYDLKPGNLRITADGRLKIIDFGLAHLLHPTCPTETQSATQGTVGGTLPYMAPEQLLGKPCDARADIYAAGIVLYEMATGRLPFAGSGPSVVEQALHREPAPVRNLRPEVGPRLGALIQKCLRKDPRTRPQTARALRSELAQALSDLKRGLGGGTPAQRHAESSSSEATGGKRRKASRRVRSLAVLPLVNLSRNPDEEFFSDGMTEELITALAKIGALKVISRTSAMRYKATTKTLEEIARELNVDGIVEGSVLRAGEQVRITAQLIYAATDEHLWAESYQRPLKDVLSLQNEVARAIAEGIRVKLTPQEKARLARAHSVTPEAHAAYLRGLHEYNRWTPESFAQAMKFFGEAIRTDSSYAMAHASLAMGYGFGGYWGFLPEREAYALAKASALKALELDESLALAHGALSLVRWFYDWQPGAAEKEMRRAIELNPSDAFGHMGLAVVLEVWREKHDESLAEMRLAESLDPLSPLVKANAGWLYQWLDRYEDAADLACRSLELFPTVPLFHQILGAACKQQGKYKEAILAADRFLELSRDPHSLAMAGALYGAAGLADKAEAMLTELQQGAERGLVSPLCFAYIYANVGKVDEAFACLEKAYQQRVGAMYWLKAANVFDCLRSDPRFWEYVRKMGLPETGGPG